MNRANFKLWIISLLIFNQLVKNIYTTEENPANQLISTENQDQVQENRSYLQQARDYFNKTAADNRVRDYFNQKSQQARDYFENTAKDNRIRSFFDRNFRTPKDQPAKSNVAPSTPANSLNTNDGSVNPASVPVFAGDLSSRTFLPETSLKQMEEELANINTNQPTTGVRRRAISRDTIQDRFADALTQEVRTYEQEKQEKKAAQQLARIKANINDPKVSDSVLTALLKSDIPEDIKNDIRTQLRLRGAGRLHDFNVNGIKHALKSDKQIILDFLHDDKNGIDENKFNDAKIQKLLNKFSAPQRVELFNDILNIKSKSANDNPEKTMQYFKEKVPGLQKIMPDYNFIYLDDSGPSPKLINVNLNGWKTMNTVAENIERIKREQNINVPSDKLQTFIENTITNIDNNKNEAALLKSTLKGSKEVEDQKSKDLAEKNKTKQDMADKAAQDLRLRIMVRNIESHLKEYLNNNTYEDTDELKLALSKLTAPEKAKLFTTIAQEVADKNSPQTRAIFHDYEEKLKILLPDTDILMVTHDQRINQNKEQGSMKSYKFKIADMQKYKWNEKLSASNNAEHLNKQQNLNINEGQLADVLEKYIAQKAKQN